MGIKRRDTKKTTVTKPKTTVRKTTKKPTTKKATGGRPRKNNRPEDFIRVSANAKPEKFAEMGKRVASGELKRAFYGIDGNVGYHYYRKLK